jgi:hypothetical protein
VKAVLSLSGVMNRLMRSNSGYTAYGERLMVDNGYQELSVWPLMGMPYTLDRYE